MGFNDAPALKKADIGIAVPDSTDAACSASDIVLTEPGLSVIISTVLTSRAIFRRMKNYTVIVQALRYLSCNYNNTELLNYMTRKLNHIFFSRFMLCLSPYVLW